MNLDSVNAKTVAEGSNINKLAPAAVSENFLPKPPAARNNDVEFSNSIDADTSATSISSKIRQAWFKDFVFFKKIDNKPFCSYCNKKLTNNRQHIIRHEKSKHHQDILDSLKPQPKINTATSESTKRNEKVKTSELKLIMFILQYRTKL